jgi:hypothetical protein
MLVPALVGGASMLMNPKAGLMGGLMAGLGAYGGANLGEALATQGMQTAGAQKLTEEAAKNAAAEGMQLPSWYQQTAASTLTPEQIAAQKGTDFMGRVGNITQGVSSLSDPGALSRLSQNLGGSTGMLKTGLAAAAPLATQPTITPPAATTDKDMGQRYTYSANKATPLPAPDVPTYQDINTKQGNFGAEQRYFVNPEFKAVTNEEAKNIYGFAGGGPVEQMSNQNAIGANTGFPQAYLHNAAYATPYQTPMSQNVLTGPGDTAVDPYTGEQKMADGGISDAGYNLGGYSDGGRLLRGPGDGVSDSIPASIGHKQPARLADGEFVVPARIVSELGNGSTEAGARKLYAMLDRVQAARGKTVGKGKVAKNSRADKYLPA